MGKKGYDVRNWKRALCSVSFLYVPDPCPIFPKHISSKPTVCVGCMCVCKLVCVCIPVCLSIKPCPLLELSMVSYKWNMLAVVSANYRNQPKSSQESPEGREEFNCLFLPVPCFWRITSAAFWIGSISRFMILQVTGQFPLLDWFCSKFSVHIK